MMKRVTYLFLGVLIAACTSIDCPVELYQVHNSDGTELTLTDSITVTTKTAKDSDTIIFNKGVGISSFSLPVSYKHPEDVLVFSFDNDNNNNLHVTDTVWIKKEDYPHFESVDCSAAFFHIITDVRYTRNYIDSIVIKNPSVTYDSKTVHFYFYPKSSN